MADTNFRTEIPVVDVREGGLLALADLHQGEMRGLRDRVFGAMPNAVQALVPLAERVSRSWLRKTNSPYLDEIEAISGILGDAGAYTINASYQWACTTNAGGSGQRLLRALDWPFEGLGATIVVARQKGPAGEFYNVTWPGAVGVLTAMAPGRFAAAINLAPLRRRTWGRHLEHLDQGINALVTLASVRDLPPDHMLRRVFEEAATYDEAVSMLARARIARPALFTLVGPEKGQSCVVEHRAASARAIQGPVTVANDWQAPESRWAARRITGSPDPRDSARRRETLVGCSVRTSAPFDWLVPPVLNATTRVAVEMDPAREILRVLGCEPDRDAPGGPARIVAASGLVGTPKPSIAVTI